MGDFDIRLKHETWKIPQNQYVLNLDYNFSTCILSQKSSLYWDF